MRLLGLPCSDVAKNYSALYMAYVPVDRNFGKGSVKNIGWRMFQCAMVSHTTYHKLESTSYILYASKSAHIWDNNPAGSGPVYSHKLSLFSAQAHLPE